MWVYCVNTNQFCIEWLQPCWASVDPLNTFISIEIHLHQTGVYFLDAGHPPTTTNWSNYGTTVKAIMCQFRLLFHLRKGINDDVRQYNIHPAIIAHRRHYSCLWETEMYRWLMYVMDEVAPNYGSLCIAIGSHDLFLKSAIVTLLPCCLLKWEGQMTPENMTAFTCDAFQFNMAAYSQLCYSTCLLQVKATASMNIHEVDIGNNLQSFMIQ